MKIETTTSKIQHPLVNEPEYLSLPELFVSHGFLTLMSILWVPTLIILLVGIKIIKKMK